MAFSSEYIQVAIRHQVYIERYKAGQAKKFKQMIDDLESEIVASIMLSEPATKAQLRQLLSDLRVIQKDFYIEYFDELTQTMLDFGEFEAGRESKALTSVVLAKDYEAKAASVDQVRRAIINSPLFIRANGGAVQLDSLFDNYSKNEIDRLKSTILSGYSQGQTTSEIVGRVKGTKAASYTDGIMNINARNADAIVRTSLQHAANTARFATWQQNQDFIVGYLIVATLDGRTTSICRSLDANVYQIGKGPLPPFHYRCRTTTAPELDEKFDFLDAGATRSSQNGYVENQSYYSWLKTQAASFQDDVLGKTRAKLFRDGGISSERFSQLQLDRNFEPVTLDELKELAPRAWAKAFN